MSIKHFNEAKEQLNLAKKILNEDYGFGGEYPQEGMAPEQYQDGMEPQDENLAKSDERIASIREIALEGLQDYAHDVDSEAYQFYKKIWLMCDKAVSEKDSVGEGNS
jgi:hypothetical protein